MIDPRSRVLFLTDDEHEVIDLLGRVANRMHAIIAPDGGQPAAGDWAEAAAAIHVLQRMIGAQASTRAYPDRYRLLGQPGAWTTGADCATEGPDHA